MLVIVMQARNLNPKRIATIRYGNSSSGESRHRFTLAFRVETQLSVIPQTPNETRLKVLSEMSNGDLSTAFITHKRAYRSLFMVESVFAHVTRSHICIMKQKEEFA